MENSKSNTTVRIIDIARMAGVSVGTVDRVLHNRGRVSEDKRKKTEAVIKEINYKPNMVARFLASKKEYTFAAIIPSYTGGSYWELACTGIERAIEELQPFNVSLRYFYFDQYDKESFMEAATTLLKEKFDGIVIATLFENYAIELSINLDTLSIPYIYIDSNIAGQNDLAYFGSDTFANGRIAAKLLIKEIGIESDIFMAHVKFKHNEVSVQMRNRESGFLNYLDESGYKGKVHQLELDPDNPAYAFGWLEKFLKNRQTPVGGIVFNSRIYELIRTLDLVSDELKKNLRLIGHDAIGYNAKALKEDKLSFLLSQRTDRQGYDAIKSLGNYLLFGQTPEKENYVPIDILVKENIDYYTNYKL